MSKIFEPVVSWARGCMAAVKAQVATVTPEGEEGQGMIEYGLIIALISIAAIALLVLFKAPLVNLFSNAVSSLGG